jgi:hypothetical protein
MAQDGGVLGTLSNLGFLLLLGVLAERLAGPGWWLAAYLGAGLAGIVGAAAVQLLPGWAVPAGRVVAVAAAAAALALLAAADLHGAALAAGILIAAAARPFQRRAAAG